MQNEIVAQVYPWQQNTWETLTGRFSTVGAWCLAVWKKRAVVKRHLQNNFFTWVLCRKRDEQTQPCGECGSCQWLKSDTHPNFVHIQY